MSEENEKAAVAIAIGTFSSGGVRNLSVGRFDFQDSILEFQPGQEADLKEFEELINHPAFPVREKHLIKKIDPAEAERKFLAGRQVAGLEGSSDGVAAAQAVIAGEAAKLVIKK